MITKYYVKGLGKRLSIKSVEMTVEAEMAALMLGSDDDSPEYFDTMAEAVDHAEKLADDRITAAMRYAGRAQNEVEAAFADLERVKRMAK